MTGRQRIWLVAMLVGGALPLVILGYWQEFRGGRTVQALALADQCVDWAHLPREQRAAAVADLIQRCNTYFRVRSERDADEDDERWKARNK
jgi:hypothetical protein